MSYEQCPKCELRFPNEPEMTFHLATDHPKVGPHLAREFQRTRDERRRMTRRLQRAAARARPPRRV